MYLAKYIGSSIGVLGSAPFSSFMPPNWMHSRMHSTLGSFPSLTGGGGGMGSGMGTCSHSTSGPSLPDIGQIYSCCSPAIVVRNELLTINTTLDNVKLLTMWGPYRMADTLNTNPLRSTLKIFIWNVIIVVVLILGNNIYFEKNLSRNNYLNIFILLH